MPSSLKCAVWICGSTKLETSDAASRPSMTFIGLRWERPTSAFDDFLLVCRRSTLTSSTPAQARLQRQVSSSARIVSWLLLVCASKQNDSFVHAKDELAYSSPAHVTFRAVHSSREQQIDLGNAMGPLNFSQLTCQRTHSACNKQHE